MNSPRILVIDDIPEDRVLFRTALQRRFHGVEVLESTDAVTAARIVAGNHLDIVVAHRTPEAREAELVRMLRQINPAVPIILVGRSNLEKQASESGASAFLHYDEWPRLGSLAGGLIPENPTWPES